MRTLVPLFLVFALPVHAQLDSGLVLFWPLNNNAIDVSGNGLDGHETAGYFSTIGRGGGAGCAYHAEKAVFNSQTSPLLSMEIDGAFTMSAWVKRTPGNPDFAMRLRSPSGPTTIGVFMRVSNTDPLFFGTSTPVVAADSSQMVFDQDWHHLVGVRDAQDWYLYYDGQLLGAELGGTEAGYVGPGYFGVGGANVEMDDVRFYDRSLSALEVTMLFEEVSDCSLGMAIAEGAGDAATLGPNPTTGMAMLQFAKPAERGATLTVFDRLGRPVLRQAVVGTTVVVDLQGQAAGIYELVLSAGPALRRFTVVKE